MVPACSRCNRALPVSDDPMRFCPYCGSSLQSDGDKPSPFLPTILGATQEFISPDQVDEMLAEPVPAVLGGYRIVRLLGKGGMGQVFEAESLDGTEKVALKVLSSQLSRNPVAVERFRQEGRLASQIAHPQCVFVLGADTDSGRPYIVMELMPGNTLKDLLDQKGPLSAQEVIPLMLDVIDGLLEAHRLGVIHRDVKPSNCFLMPNGRVKIGDFGLSKSLGASAQLTRTGAFLGTVLYASPEQIRGQEVDYASDVYSVCATMYHLLTGQAPFQHENITAALAKAISEDPPKIRSIRPEVPRPLARIVERGLERDRERRYPNLEELRAALVALIPDHLSYGGLGIRIMAFLLDWILIHLLLVQGKEFLANKFGSNSPAIINSVVLLLYFVWFEGRNGASLGKWLLSLRVYRFGSTEPPGLGRTFLRTLIFASLILFTIAQTRMTIEQIEEAEFGLNILLWALPFLVGLLLLIVPMRKRNDFRGLHELLSGTCVMRLPRRQRPIRLLAGKENPLQLLPERTDDIPKQIGPYPIQAGIESKDQYVLLGEDSLLGRRLLIVLSPPGTIPDPKRQHLHRPTRLRLLSNGKITWKYKEWTWEAFVAPLGSPLQNLTSPKRRLSWPETLRILQQLTEELTVAQADGSLPKQLSLEQVWVQPDGRLQLIDLPIPTGSPVDNVDSMTLVRQTTLMALEGRLRPVSTQDRIRAPLPEKPASLLGRFLSGSKSVPNLDVLRTELNDLRNEPMYISQPHRLLHLLVQLGLMSLPLLILFLISGLFTVSNIFDQKVEKGQAEQLIQALKSPEWLAKQNAEGKTWQILKDPVQSISRLEQISKEAQEIQDQLQPNIGQLERFVLRRMERAFLEPLLYGESVASRQDPANQQVYQYPSDETVARLDAAVTWFGISGEARRRDLRLEDAISIILFIVVLNALSAAIFRGGLGMFLIRIVPMRYDGRMATRWQCALRSLILWLPIGVLLIGCVWLQENQPGSVNLYMTLWWTAFLLLPFHAVLALMFPERTPIDRWVGVKLMPR